jgi:hypothetical protein
VDPSPQEREAAAIVPEKEDGPETAESPACAIDAQLARNCAFPGQDMRCRAAFGPGARSRVSEAYLFRNTISAFGGRMRSLHGNFVELAAISGNVTS